MNYPYQTAFERDLVAKELATTTIADYRATLASLFTYLSQTNVAYQADHRVTTLRTNDIDDYLAWLMTTRQLSTSTYNKVLSHLNVYFKFLFIHGWTTAMPTLALTGKQRSQGQLIPADWWQQLATLLQDSHLHVYTRLTILLSHRYYPAAEFLAPGFGARIETTQWTPPEQALLKELHVFRAPLIAKHGVDDWFLKQRVAANPHLTQAGLHKYLKVDEPRLGVSLAPSRLYQSAIIAYLQAHPTTTTTALEHTLRLDPAGVAYYQHLAQIIE